MSTSIPTTHLGRHGWSAPLPRPREPRRALWRALVDALVPGEAAADVVPALQAADAQALLVRAGELDDRHATARWDRPTVDAVARFQRHRGLPCTGVADRRTADALLAA
ncbi:peptidoglycan-binding domain-containing protein [Patulibacter sp. SYSU D01012]|uniref:peptidoglycan-binding domain-containing protein n=1 Tax=Patulibacter sp. SYSU D01012 TaxID=2817381 RepID=UPI001B30B47C|nr:peptidoglycan-binding domain-containing protein [Patulibacter sp. SYSU D01012]